MKNIQFYIWFCFLFFTLSGFESSKMNSACVSEKIKAYSYSPKQPILIGVGANPVLRVLISVPPGFSEQHYKGFKCTLNPEAINCISKLNVYITGAEPFSTQSLLTSIKPSSTKFIIPVNLSCNSGVRFIWFSIVLRNDSSICDKIEMHCNRILGEDGKELIVKEDNSGYIKRTGIVLRKGGDGGANTFRIPGIVQTNKGTLIAVYDIRYNNSADLPGNIDIGMSRSTNGGGTWEPMKVIMDMGVPEDQNGVGDPSILFDPMTKQLWVAALWSKGNHSIAGSIGGLSPDSTGQFVLVNSSDDGLTWSSSINITTQIKTPGWKVLFQGPGRGIAMEDGRLVFPAQYWDESKVPFSTIIYSNDHGNSWKGKIIGPKSNTTESQVVESTPGTLMLNMRDNRGAFRSVATTNDMGTTWTEHTTSYNALADPVCMGSLIKAKMNVKGVMKDVLFFSNPNTPSGRYNITIKASLDLGETWSPVNQTLVDERQCYGYSCLTKVDDNTIGILYEGIKDLYFVKVPVNDIIK